MDNPVVCSLVSKQVIHMLGEPKGLHAVQVRKLWDNHYRVNVLIGEDAVFAKISNSYFVETDSNGNIVHSNPMITNSGSVH